MAELSVTVCKWTQKRSGKITYRLIRIVRHRIIQVFQKIIAGNPSSLFFNRLRRASQPRGRHFKSRFSAKHPNHCQQQSLHDTNWIKHVRTHFKTHFNTTTTLITMREMDFIVVLLYFIVAIDVLTSYWVALACAESDRRVNGCARESVMRTSGLLQRADSEFSRLPRGEGRCTRWDQKQGRIHYYLVFYTRGDLSGLTCESCVRCLFET